MTGIFEGSLFKGNYEGFWKEPDGRSYVKFNYSAKGDYQKRLLLDFQQIQEIIKYEFEKYDVCKNFNEYDGNCNPVLSIADREEFRLSVGDRLYAIVAANPNDDYTCNACSPMLSVFVFKIINGDWVLDSKHINTQLFGRQGEYYFGSLVQLGVNLVGIKESGTIYKHPLQSNRNIVYTF